jgi:hypothetical protein
MIKVRQQVIVVDRHPVLGPPKTSASVQQRAGRAVRRGRQHARTRGRARHKGQRERAGSAGDSC